jgi:integrase/recombinase XerC
VPQPAVLLRGLKVPKRIVRVLKSDEVERLLDPDRFEAGWLGTRDRFLLLTLYALGIRRAELLQMRWADVDGSAQTVRILGKGNKERLLPALSVWLEGLEEYRRACETSGISTDSVLFWESAEKTMTPKRVYSVVHSYLQSASSVEKASPHVLRHTFATHLLDMGADLASIRSLLGHANLSATQVYTHASIEQLKSVVQRAHPRGREGQRS